MAFRMAAARLRRLLNSLSALEPGVFRSPWAELSGVPAPCVPSTKSLATCRRLVRFAVSSARSSGRPFKS